MDLTLFGEGGGGKFYMVLQCLDTFLFSSQCGDIVTGDGTTIVCKTFFTKLFSYVRLLRYKFCDKIPTGSH